MAERKQVQRLERDTIVKPTAQLVDTYYRPEQKQVDPTAEMLANALGKLVPGIATKAGKDEKERQQALAEKQHMADLASGFKITRDNIMSGQEYFQDSPIALKHLQTLRAQTFVENNLAEFNRDLFAGNLTDQQGNPLQIASREQLQQQLMGKIQDVTQIGGEDEFIITAIAPKIREWQHNTVVKWEAQEHKKLLAERENLYANKLGNIFRDRAGKTTEMVQEELRATVDSYYALGDSKATEIFVDQLISLADANNDTSIIDTALGVKPGGRNLTPSQLEKLIEGREKIEKEVEDKVTHVNKVAEAKRKRDKEQAQDDAFNWLIQQGPDADLNDPEYLQIMKTYSDNGGNATTLLSSHRTMVEKMYTTVTPSNRRALDAAKIYLTGMAQSPTRNNQSMDSIVGELIEKANMEGPLRPGMEFARSLHPSALAELRTYAKGLENANNYMSDPDVNAVRKSFIENTIGSKGSFSDIGTEYAKQKLDKEQEFDTLLNRRLTEAYIESGGTLGTAQVRTIAQNTLKELLTAQQAEADNTAVTKLRIESAAKKSLKGWNNSGEDWLIDDDLNDMYVPEQYQGMTGAEIDTLQERFTQVFADPLAVNDGVEAWQQFDNIYWPGAFAYYSMIFKNIYFE